MGEAQSKDRKSVNKEIKNNATDVEKLLKTFKQKLDINSVANFEKVVRNNDKEKEDVRDAKKKEMCEKENGKTKDVSLLPLWIGLGVGAGALVSIIAAPFVIAGIGFGAGGIAAGSIAAAWMSASGPVAAGSLIAILQSIGAAGMGAASLGVAAAAGGAVGGGIATGVSLAALKSSESDEDKSSNPEQNTKIRSDDSDSYKIKAKEMKLLFKELPSDEWLIVDYSGALVKDILAQGRLYLTTSHFCFHSNTIGRKITKVLNFRDITNITKETYSENILQFQLTTETGKFLFANFEACDESYELLVSIWKISRNSEVANPVWLLRTITGIYGMDLGFRDTEEATAFFLPSHTGIK